MNTYLKFFLWSLPPIGLIYFVLGILLDLAFGRPLELVDVLINSLFFALFFGGVMSVIHFNSVKGKLKRKPSFEDLKSFQEESLQLNTRQEELFRLLSEQPLKRAKSPQLKNGIIRIKTSSSDASWGEYLEIEMLNESDQRFVIRSRPIVKLNYFDFGKAIENLNQLKAHLRKLDLIIPV